MLSGERKKKLSEVVNKIHDAMSEATTEADLSNEEANIVLCAVVSGIQQETIEYLKSTIE